MCTSSTVTSQTSRRPGQILAKYSPRISIQVNIPAESGEMGVLASHVPSIEQLKPGLIEVIEEAGGSKQFFRVLDLAAEGIISNADDRWHSLRRICGRPTRVEVEHQRC